MKISPSGDSDICNAPHFLITVVRQAGYPFTAAFPCDTIAAKEEGRKLHTNRLLTVSEALAYLPALLREHDQVPLLVTGNSMTPFLRDRRDVVYLRDARQFPAKKGDIILFSRPGGQALVLHRINQINADGSYVVNGDAQVWCERVLPAQVLAVVAYISRDGKAPYSARRWDKRLLSWIWRRLRPMRPRIFRVIGRLSRKN